MRFKEYGPRIWKNKETAKEAVAYILDKFHRHLLWYESKNYNTYEVKTCKKVDVYLTPGIHPLLQDGGWQAGWQEDFKQYQFTLEGEFKYIDDKWEQWEELHFGAIEPMQLRLALVYVPNEYRDSLDLIFLKPGCSGRSLGGIIGQHRKLREQRFKN